MKSVQQLRYFFSCERHGLNDVMVAVPVLPSDTQFHLLVYHPSSSFWSSFMDVVVWCSKADVTKHERTHKTELLHACAGCGRRFRDISTCSRHQKQFCPVLQPKCIWYVILKCYRHTGAQTLPVGVRNRNS